MGGYTRRVCIFTLKSKDENFVTFKHWKVLVENHKGSMVQILRIENY